MRDINFFNIYKRKKGKNNGFRTFIIVFASVFVLFNVLLVGGYLRWMNRIGAYLLLMTGPYPPFKLED